MRHATLGLLLLLGCSTPPDPSYFGHGGSLAVQECPEGDAMVEACKPLGEKLWAGLYLRAMGCKNQGLDKEATTEFMLDYCAYCTSLECLRCLFAVLDYRFRETNGAG